MLVCEHEEWRSLCEAFCVLCCFMLPSALEGWGLSTASISGKHCKGIDMTAGGELSDGQQCWPSISVSYCNAIMQAAQLHL